ncbi:Long chain acyl-CoA synthetase 7, peroxisomal [Tritrichomonas foetus]|uniref:Long chain acyl-CoA synthetase 7, peroxisomal n=1 Tax=Tritrichomonas foetus TaxID=1144522 RepID=A0A1J4KT35_9EUKA|nr:Long chain acyl-CoA synthetase 7, peroxisomal [Tritrichomonas foetus]|eukprot:OHT12948.1 Long chain acyl-CoA synthetase 7, peroxisomal [Tritrichomonas foetus]
MGQVQSLESPGICVPTNEPAKPGESRIYRNSHCFEENGGDFIATFRSQPESMTPIDIMRVCSVKYANWDCTGERHIYPDGTAGEYEWMSFKDFYESCLAMGRGLLSLGLKRGDKVGIYSSNSRYWQTIAFGAYSVGIIIVPVYDSLGADAAEYIINHSGLKVVFSSVYKFKNSVALLPKIPNVTHLVVMSNHLPNEPDVSQNANIQALTITEVLEKGKNSDFPNEFGRPDDVAILMYTSGSTGLPKGCLITHRNIVAGGAGLASVNASLLPGDTFMSFLPLAHIYALCVELIMLAQGCRVGYARGAVKDLVDDIRTLQPSVFIAVPRILNKVAEVMKSQIDALPRPMRAFVNWSFAHKIKQLKDNHGTSFILEGLVFAKFRLAMGGKLRCIISGGAPILPEIFEFFCAAVCPGIIQGYGMTELSSAIAVQEWPAWNPATVGPCVLSCEFKLIPVEGTDYDPTAEEEPAGELLIRGPGVFKGYYNRPDLEDKTFVEGGWFPTGDVVKLTKEKHLQIIDRAKQLVKLSQGEYLSMSTLNEVYAMADVLSFIYVYASPMYDQPIAVCVPKQEKIKEWEAEGVKDVTTDLKVRKEILDSLNKVFVERKLRGFERIRYIIIDTYEPTIENGLLTPSMKPQYAALRKKYEPQLMELYQLIAEKKITSDE